ncbi:PAN2-PAN3 deadenylation complex subunit pan3 isoform X4 [Eurytemora carolleeae]|uniref:PAN2-PAN3 deadenylation complex subunit pan3 isoform X4 n=1 Tax=Eurytemora carolleeae TaxID=1294199 RepID=UPI000C77DD1A|nr:PAN2-PAN3 deadenylation complex subunit pan3 isoform X4 [Eurytemora carolleeae]|eukprot:XP_023349501.1 PAN2-PAN3 deadenylation complex subunit pan3-like isoform X4 [Eurytemora affinis]
MMEQMYLPYTSSSPGPYRHMGPGGPPQGSKLGTYMNRGVGGPNPNTGQYQDMSSKINSLSLDPGMKIMNRQSSAPGRGLSPSSPGFVNPRFPSLNSGMQGPGGSMYGGGGPSFKLPAPIQSYPVVYGRPPPLGPPRLNLDKDAILRDMEKRTGGAASRLSPTMRLNPAAQLQNPPPMRPTGNVTPQPSPEQEAQAAASAAKVTVFSENGTTYFYNPDETLPSQLSTGQVVGNSLLVPNWSAYSGTPSQVVAMKVRNAAPTSLQESETKMELITRQMICHTIPDPQENQDIPSEVDNFTSLCPLEPPASSPLHKSSTFSYVTTVYKSVNIKTGQHMCLRRIHGYRLVNTKCMGLVEQWKKMSHSNLVTLRQVFTSKSFNDHSMIFVYDYYPGSETLMTRHFSSELNPQIDPYNGDTSRPYSQNKNLMRHQPAAINNTGLLAEALIWNYVIQLTSALRYIHSAGLACRTLDPTKILVLGRCRLLLNCSGIFDVLTYDPNSANPMAAMSVYQQEDLVSLGRIVLALACNSFHAIQREQVQQSMELVTSNYSSDLRNLIMYLLTNSQRVKSVNDLMPMIGARFYTALDSAMQRSEMLEQELARELESSRIVRLLTKLSTVVDRPEFNMDVTWSETGDRYMLKLFRDYLFHQITEDGRPFLDMSHVITNLNRLDAGIPDQSADGRVFQKFATIGFVWSETRNRFEVQSDKVDFFDSFNIFF